MTGRGQFERLVRGAAGFAELSGRQMEVLWGHYELLARWNRKLNLTRVVEVAEVVRVHYVESLFVAAQIPRWVRTVVDVGSGAGFPGFVVAVVRPECQVTLMEGDRRKAAFLREAGDLVGGVRVLAARSEEVCEAFDAVISRAVRAEEVLAFGRRAGRWMGLVMGAREAGGLQAWGGRCVALPGGRGVLWTWEVPRETGAGG